LSFFKVFLLTDVSVKERPRRKGAMLTQWTAWEMVMRDVRERREVRRVRKAGHEVVEILLAGCAEKIFDEEVDRLLDETRSDSVTDVVRKEGADVVH
jgi:hypothetical protein